LALILDVAAMPMPAVPRSLVAVFGLALACAAAAQEASAPAEPTAAAVTTPPDDADPVARGAYLATAGNCMTCHTRPGGDAFAGGVPFYTDFGTIYSTNITSDATAGIGSWSEADFARAMREGIAKDGTHLYPAFPYPSFATITDADMAALYAYIKTIAPSTYAPPANDMGFPFNQRPLMAIWNALFLKSAVFAPDSAQSPEWNRGAYLVNGLAHCGACHTPRNVLGAEIADQALSGGVLVDEVKSGDVRRWSAINLTQAHSGLKAWSAADIAAYLKTGHSSRGATNGPMNEVTFNSTMKLSAEDTMAMAVYLKSLAPIERAAPAKPDAQVMRQGETLYTIHCGTCHLPTGLGSKPGSELGPPLVGSAIAQSPDPSSMINLIIHGGDLPTPQPPGRWQNMKAFGNILDDDEIAAIATYVRTSWGNLGSPVTEADVAKQH
jgi:mono/diheme cytochrome c family protein